MNKHIKKLILTGASLLMFASVGAGINNINANASKIYEDQYPSKFNKLIPGGSAHHNFYKHGYLFHAKRAIDSPGMITGINNDYRVTKLQVVAALKGKKIFKKHYRKHSNKKHKSYKSKRTPGVLVGYWYKNTKTLWGAPVFNKTYKDYGIKYVGHHTYKVYDHIHKATIKVIGHNKLYIKHMPHNPNGMYHRISRRTYNHLTGSTKTLLNY